MEIVKKQKYTWLRVFSIGVVIGMITFIAIYGYKVLDPTYDGWLLNYQGDMTQHYIGWEFFRKSPWTFPIGLTEGLKAGQAVSCMYTDSIPLFAIFFKLLSPLLPETFQYIGIWGLFSFAMQGGVSSLLLYRITKQPVFSLIGSLFYIASPPILRRLFGHEALAGHWLIILALLSWAYQNRKWKYKATPVIVWCINGMLAVLIHSYFIPMIYFIMLGYIITDVFANKKLLRPVITFFATSASTVIVMYIIGAFYGKGDLAAGGLGIYSSNYNAFFNSMGLSKYLKSLNCTQEQGEGFAFLGLGIIVAGAFTLMLLPVLIEKKGGVSYLKKLPNKNKVYIAAIAIVFFFSFIYAASPRGTLNARVIYDIQLPESLRTKLGIFRCTGRISWVALYIMYTFVLYCISKIGTKKTAAYAAALLVAVQYLDLSEYITAKYRSGMSHVTYNTKLVDPMWEELAEESNEIVFAPLPPSYLTKSKIYFTFAEYADEHDMELSSFYLARASYEELKNYSDDKLERFIKGKSDGDEIFVFFEKADVPKDNEFIEIYDVDGFYIAVTQKD